MIWMIKFKIEILLLLSEEIINKTRIDVYETLCLQQMLVHKGGKIKNWGGECRDVAPTKLQSQNIFKESTGGVGWGGQDGCERRIKVFVKIKKKNCGGGSVRGGGSGWGGGGSGWM